MAAVAESKKEPGEKFSAQVDEQIAQATSRIRVHDLTLGGLTLAAMVVVYATAMILLDKSLNLPEVIRQLSLLGFIAAFLAVGYFLIGRPLRKRINPLYAAARVEDTIEDAKNSVTGYVESQETGTTPASVKAAMSARAAKAVGEADVNRAVDHRNLLIAGGVLVLCLVVLAVLFFVFRPTQFKSLVGRAFVPFTASPIASRTQLTLTKPDNPEPTLTTGQTITVGVYVGGRVPAKDSPEKVRLLLRHNPADPDFEELTMEQGDSTRDWQVKVPEYLVQNGFWYKVAAGDTETREYHVSVRSLPLFTDFDAGYEYPKYLRRLPDRGTDPNLRAYRGTKITLLARTNREVKDGVMRFEAAGLAPVPGTPAPGRPDTLAFKFTATEATRYRLSMTTTGGETNADPPPFQISLDADSPPRVEITRPEEPETTAPANGQLTVDGTIGDDFGIDKVRLRIRVDKRDLEPLLYEGGKSFRRDTDGTWPNDLVYKGSADLTKLHYADGGKEAFAPKENMVLEYWLEAIDNCTETKPVEGWGEKPQPGQVGRSETRRLVLTAPKTEAEEKEQLNQEKKQRQNEEKQHNQQQQQKFDKENRQPDKPQDGKQPDPKAENPPDKNDMPKDEKQPEGKQGDRKEQQKDKGKEGKGGTGTENDPNPKKDPTPPKNPEAKKDAGGMGMGPAGGEPPPKPPGGMPDSKMDPKTDPKMGQKSDPKSSGKSDPTSEPPKGMSQPMGGGMGGGMSNPEPKQQAPMPKDQDQRQAEKEAERVKQELDKNKGQGGEAKPSSTADGEKKRTEPAEPKPQQPPPMPRGGMESQSKEAPPPEPKGNPMGDKSRAADAKPQGNLEQPADPNPESKPEPDAKDNPAEKRDAPLGGAAGQDKAKPEPKKDNPGAPQPKKDDKKPNEDPESGSKAKPCTNPQPGDASGKPGMSQDDAQPNPTGTAGEAKSNVEPARGQDKDLPKSKGAPPPQKRPDPRAGDGKPQQAPPAAGTKPPPKNADGLADKGPPPSEDKTPPKDPMGAKGENAAAEGRTPPPMNPMGMGGGDDNKRIQPGSDKTPMGGDAGSQNANNAEAKKKEPKGDGSGKKPDEKDLKAIEDAARDMKNPDPQKQDEAKRKLDDALKKENEASRKELDQLAKDLNSPEKNTRDAAERKLERMKEEAKKRAEQEAKKDEQGGKKLSPEEVAELEKKLSDLNSPDPAKREAAEKLFDEKLGKDARKELQEELRKEAEQATKPRDGLQPPKLSDEEVRQLQQQVRDLDSPDADKREAAEQLFDQKVGPDARKQIQKEVKDRNEEIKKRIAGPDTSKQSPPDPTDPRNKARTAQLQLEEFEKHRYDPDLQEKLGWSPEKWTEFLKKERERVEQLQKEAESAEKESLLARPAPTGAPTITPGGAGKVESRSNGLGTSGSAGSAGFAPADYADAKKKFAELLLKAQQKK